MATLACDAVALCEEGYDDGFLVAFDVDEVELLLGGFGIDRLLVCGGVV